MAFHTFDANPIADKWRIVRLDVELSRNGSRVASLIEVRAGPGVCNIHHIDSTPQ